VRTADYTGLPLALPRVSPAAAAVAVAAPPTAITIIYHVLTTSVVDRSEYRIRKQYFARFRRLQTRQKIHIKDLSHNLALR